MASTDLLEIIDQHSERCPALLHYYCRPNGVQLLTDFRVRIRPPTQFNDPFEWAPVLAREVSVQEVTEFFRRPDMRAKFFAQWGREPGPTDIADAKARAAASAAHVEREFRNGVDRHIGVWCMSARWNQPLMWGHYADGHRGFVVSLEPSAFSGKLEGLRPQPVQYRSRRVLTTSVFTQPDDRDVVRVVLTKSAHWRYEREYRFVVFLHWLAKVGDDHFLDFKESPRLIHSITLGAQCTAGAKIVEALKHPSYEHVRLYAAKMSDERFAVIRSPFKRS